MTTKEEIKRNENIAVNEPEFNERNITKFNKDHSNFNERANRDYNNTLNQQKDIISKTLDNTLHNIERATDEATREIPKYTQRIAEYQEQTIQTIKVVLTILKQKTSDRLLSISNRLFSFTSGQK